MVKPVTETFFVLYQTLLYFSDKMITCVKNKVNKYVNYYY